MTKRDYVLSAINHRSTDRVPFCIRLTGEACDLYGQRLLSDYFNRDVSDDLKEGNISFMQAVELSIGNFMIDPGTPWWGWNHAETDPVYSRPDEEPRVMPALVRYDSDRAMDAFYAKAKFFADKYQVYNMSLIWGSHWEKAYFTRGIENFLADLAGFPGFAQRLLDFIVGINMQILPRIASCVYTDGILLGSDWGTQNDLIMSPRTWHTMIKKGEKVQYDLIKSYNKDVMVHSCGNITKLIEALIGLGVDILNPVQPECMDLKKLKQKYGDKLTFWGGISTQKTLPYGTPEEVAKETGQTIMLMSQNGGYITCASQEIQCDVPYENLKALIDTARSFA
ncbi:MAG: uroporphyrinogen decarboxylase family protein [Eubacteriales bacterium]|jgi:uroporphyrinogen decarboxylase|nr:uroporphyrinogen decarboxylase family protein [Eubacteriales bacterium]